MSRLSMKDGRIVIGEQDEKPKNTTQKTNTSNSRLSMVDGRIVLADKPVEKAANNQQYLQKTRAAQQQYQAMDDVLPQRNNVMDMALNSLRNRVTNSAVGKGANEWARRVSGIIQNGRDESPEHLARKQQAKIDRAALIDQISVAEDARKEALQKQWEIDNAQLIDQASSQYEGPTITERGKRTVIDMSDADMFSNDWSPESQKEVEYERTVQNPRYEKLGSVQRDAILDKWENGNLTADEYQELLYLTEKYGGIDQLKKEQVQDMSRWDRFKGTVSGVFSSAGENLYSGYVLGNVAKGYNMRANQAMEEYDPALEATARRWFWGIVNGADNEETEEAVRQAAAYIGGDAYADKVVSRVRERANQAIVSDDDPASFEYNLLDGIEPMRETLWENLQGTIEDTGIYEDIMETNASAEKHLQQAKDLNNIQDLIGYEAASSIMEGAESTIENAADALIAGALGFAGSGLSYIPFISRSFGGSYASEIQGATEGGRMLALDEEQKASLKSGFSAGIEYLTERMWSIGGALGKRVTGGGALDDLAQDALSKAITGFAKSETGAEILLWIGEKLLGGATEGLEEIAGNAAEQLLKLAGIMPGEPQDIATWWEDTKRAGAAGFWGGILGNATNIVAAPLQQSQIGKQLKAGGLDISLSELADLANSEGMENTSLAKAYSDVFSGMPRNIENISDLEAGKLYTAYEEMLGKRSDAIDRIEQMQAKVEAGETLTRADVNRITNNSDAVAILSESGAVSEDAFSGGINERRDAVEMALRAFANDSTALSETDADNVQAGTESANTAVSAPNPFLVMSQSAIDNALQQVQPMSTAESLRAEADVNASNQLLQNMARSIYSVSDAAERLGASQEAADTMARLYSPSKGDTVTYTGQAIKYVNQGENNEALDLTDKEGDVLTPIEKRAFWNVGRMNYLREVSQNGETKQAENGELRVHDGGEWNDSAYSAGSLESMAEVAGGNPAGQSGYQQPAAAAQGIRQGAVGRRIASDGVDAKTMRSSMAASGYKLVDDVKDQDYAKVKKIADSHGYDLVAWRGGLGNFDGTRARGLCKVERNDDGSVKKVTLFVQLDNDKYTAEQTAIHEATHGDIATGKITLPEAKTQMIKTLGGEDNFYAALDAYADAYHAGGALEQDENGKYSEKDLEAIFEEMVCDAPAGMNAFAEVQHFDQMRQFRPAMSAAKAATENKNPNGTRGSPAERGSLGKASIDLTADALGVDAYRDETGKVHFRVDGREVKKITAEHVKNNSAIGVLIKAGEASKFITAKEAEEQYKAAADLMNMIMSTQDPEMIWAFSGATMFSALKKNSDGQYGTTIDFTTVCRKTQEMVTAMSNAMREAGRGLTKKEVTDLQHDVLESGAEVPCPVCYVFSRWTGIGGMLDDIVRLQDKYAKFTKEQITARTNELKKEIIARGLGSKDKKGRPTVTGSGATALMKELEAEANDAKAKIEWYEDGKKGAVTEAEYKRLKKELPAMQENIGILSEWTWSSQIVTRADYKAVPKDILFDLDAGAKFASEYPAVWKYRTTRGPSSGKAILPYSSMRTGDIITGAEPSATVRGLFTDIVTNKSKMRGKMTKKQDEAYQKAVLRTAAQNLIGGQRYQSTSDFRYEYALDYIQSFWELQALGSKLQTYTKVVEYADIIAAVGGDVNLSVMPLRSGVENGKLIFSNQTGMNIGAALEANRKFDNAQLILVGINDEHILAALDDHHGTGGENIGFVIPYHASGASITDFISELVKNLGERFVNSNYRDYSAVQNDKEKADRTAEQIMRAEIRKKLLTGKSGVRWNKAKGTYESNVKRNELTKEELDLIRGKSADISGRTFEDLRNVELKALAGDKAAIREYLSWSAGVLNDLYEKMYNGAEKDTVLNSSQAEHIMPHEYWNTNTTRANAYVNGFIFRSYCYSMGLMPRFSWTVGSGENAHGDLSGSDGYWKTLIDRPMYNNDGTYRAQQRINVTDFNNAMLKPSYAEKTYPKYKIQEPNRSRAEKVGTEFGKKISGKLSRDIDTSAFTESQLSNYNYNQKQTETGSTLKTLGGSAIKRSKYGVGKDIGGRIYMHRDYADSVIPEDVYESAKQALAEAYPDFDYNCVEWSEKDGIVRFDEAPGFDTEREPIVGDYVTVNPDGTTKKGHTDYIWHHKWLWVKDDYKGFDVRDAWEWSKDWLSTISGKTYEVNGKEYNDRGKSDGNGIGRWNAQLDAYGLPRDSAGKFSMDLDEDAAPVRQDHTSRGTSINTTKLPVLYKLADAKGGFKSGTVNIDIGAGVEGTPATAYLAERGVNSLPFDPFNRNRETNMAVMDFLKSGKKADTATCSNVLNVIDNEQARANVILQMAKAIKPDGTAYFTVYSDEKRLEAGKAGEVSSKPDQWQELRAAKTYVPEIKKYFDDVPDPKSGLIIARKPKANLPKATWQITSTEYTDKEGNKPYSKDEAIRFSRDLDTQYMAAAESGDTETAQRLVDEAAKAAGYTVKAYHGTHNFGRTKFNADWPTYLTSKPGTARAFSGGVGPRSLSSKNNVDSMTTDELISAAESSTYMKNIKRATKEQIDDEYRRYNDYGKSKIDSARAKGEPIFRWSDDNYNDGIVTLSEIKADLNEVFNNVRKGGTYTFYVNPGDALTVYGDGAYYTSIPVDGMLAETLGKRTASTDEILKVAADLGFDSVIYKDIAEGGDYGRAGRSDVYAVVRPDINLKSADPITYDDDGNIIPLEDRFNPKNDDIRFSRDLDSAGNQLTEGQQEFFKDSKVRDEKGRLLVLYHGTHSDKFTVFENRPFRNGLVHGEGFYFTPKEKEAKSWGPNVYKVYLNIKNPYYVSDTSPAPKKIVDMAKEKYGRVYDEFSLDEKWWGNKYTRDGFIEEQKRMYDTSYGALSEAISTRDIPSGLSESQYYTEVAKRKTDLLKSLGYDGVIVNLAKPFMMAKEEYVAFYPEQIKRVNNQKPTENPDIRFSRDLDADYMKAVESKNMDVAKRMVYEASRKAGFNSPLVYHGTYESFNVFKGNEYLSEINGPPKIKGYFTEDKSVAEVYGEPGEYYVRIDNPLEFADNDWQKTIGEWEKWFAERGITGIKFDSSTEKDTLKQHLYDGVPYYSVFDIFDGADLWQGDGNLTERIAAAGYDGIKWDFDEKAWIPFNDKYIKRADAVTYDDAGNIIPLSERFNPKNDDIRFSRDLSNTELYEANRQLQKDLTELRSKLKTRTEQRDYWRRQTQKTEDVRLKQDVIKNIAKEVIKTNNSKADQKAVAEKLNELGNILLQTDNENWYDDARMKCYEIAHMVNESAEVLDQRGGEHFYKDFRDALKQAPIYVAPSVREEVAPDGWNDFRKAQFGTVNMTADQNKGKSVDTVYHDLQATFGEWLLPEYVTSEADQLNKILEVVETYRPIYENMNSYEMAEANEWVANEILTRTMELMEIGELRQEDSTRADIARERLNAEKQKSAEALKQVRQQRDRKVQNLKDHYQQMAEDRRNRKIDSEMRTRLLNIAKRLNNKKLDRVQRALLDKYIGDLDLVSKSLTGRTIHDLEYLKTFYEAYKERMGEDFIPDKFIEKKIDRLNKKHISDMTQEEVADLTTVLLNLETLIRTENKLIDSQIKADIYAAGSQTIDDVNNSNGKDTFLSKAIGAETATPERYLHRITGYRENSPLYQAAKELSDGQRKMLDYQMRAESLFLKWTRDKKFTRRIAGKHAEEITISGRVNGEMTDVKITPAMRMALYLHEQNDDNMRHISQGGVKIPNMELYKKGKLQEAYDKGVRVALTRGQVREIVSHMSAEERAFANAVSAYYNGMSRNEINDTSEKLRGYAIAGVEKYYPIDSDGAFLRKEFDQLKRDGTLEGMGILKERIEGASNAIMLYDMNDTLNRSISQHSKYVGLAIPVRNFNRLYGVTTFKDKAPNYNQNAFDSTWEYDTSVIETIQKNWGSTATNYISKMMTDLQNGTGLKDDFWGGLLAKARSHYAGAVLTTNLSVAMKQAASYPTAAAVVGYKALRKALADFRKYGEKTVDMDKLAEYTPLYWYRSKGFSTTELGDIGKEGRHIPKALNWIQGIDMLTTRKLAKAAMYYVEDNNKDLVKGTDAWWKEVARVYNRIIEETQPNYTMMQRPQILRSDNALTRALQMFKTQPFQNFNILYDAFGNLAAKSREYKANATEENLQALKSARTNVARAVSSQAVSAIVFALMQWAWDAFRGKVKKYRDDDDEKDLLSWLKGIGLNVASSVGGMIPFGSYALELGEAMFDAILKGFNADPIFDQTFYGMSENASESLNDMGNALLNIVSKTSKTLEAGELTENSVRSLADSVEDIAQFAGVPVKNVVNLMQAIARNVILATEEDKFMAQYKALRITTDPAKYKSDYYGLLEKAYRYSDSSYGKLYNALISDKDVITGKESFATESNDAKANIDASVKKWGYALLEDAWHNRPDEYADLREKMINLPGDPFATSSKTSAENIDAKEKAWKKEQSNQSEKKETLYQTVYDEMVNTDLWGDATEAQRSKALDNLLNLSLEVGVEGTGGSSGAKAKEIIDGGERVGLDATEYMLFQLALSMADPDGGTHTNAQYEQAINTIPSLSEEEKAYLWSATHKSDKNNPWR